MKKMMIMAMLFAFFAFCFVPISTRAATTTTTTTKTTVKKRSDGGKIETKVTTTVTKKTVGKRVYKTTKVVTKVIETAADGFVETEKTTTETTTEEYTIGSKKTSMYKDVTKKKVGSKSYKAVKYLKAHGAFSGVVKGKKFYPNKKITKKQYLRILRNLYGNAAPKDAKASGYVTEKYALNKLVQVAKNLGISITWKGRSNRLTRVDVARYIKIFIDFDPAFRKNLIR